MEFISFWSLNLFYKKTFQYEKIRSHKLKSKVFQFPVEQL